MRSKLILLFVLIAVAALAYGPAIRYNFWRDDWSLIWMALYKRQFVFSWLLSIRHPGEIVNTYLLAPLYGHNVLLWSIHGLILKILASISIWYLVKSISNNSKYAYLSALVAASTYVGMESFTWISARLSVILFIDLSIALGLRERLFYSLSRSKFIFVYFAFLIVCGFGVWAEPGRMVFAFPLLLLWDICQIIINSNRSLKVMLLLNLSTVLVMLLIFISTNFGRTVFHNYGNSLISVIRNKPDLLQNYFHTLSVVANTYIFTPNESSGLPANPDASDYRDGIALVVFSISIILFGLLKKHRLWQIGYWFIWAAVFYIPGWLSEMPLVVGATHRFFTVSSIGLVLATSQILYSVINKYKNKGLVLTIIFIISSTFMSNAINAKQYQNQGYDITQKYYDKQDSDVAVDQKQKLFIVTGQYGLRGFVFDWGMTGSVAYAFKHGIADEYLLPLYGVNLDKAAELVCHTSVSRPHLTEWIIQKDSVSIDHVYSWDLQLDGKLINTSVETRNKILNSPYCITAASAPVQL